MIQLIKRLREYQWFFCLVENRSVHSRIFVFLFSRTVYAPLSGLGSLEFEMIFLLLCKSLMLLLLNSNRL